MRRAIMWAAKLILVRFVWNKVVNRFRNRAARVFTLRNLFGESLALWMQMRRLK